MLKRHTKNGVSQTTQRLITDGINKIHKSIVLFVLIIFFKTCKSWAEGEWQFSRTFHCISSTHPNLYTKIAPKVHQVIIFVNNFRSCWYNLNLDCIKAICAHFLATRANLITRSNCQNRHEFNCKHTILSIPFGPRLVRIASATASKEKPVTFKNVHFTTPQKYLKKLTFRCCDVCHSNFCWFLLILEGLSPSSAGISTTFCCRTFWHVYLILRILGITSV